jgi:hypothetical protein
VLVLSDRVAREFSVGDSHGKFVVWRLCMWLEVIVYMLRSVARRRLVETENPSACAMVNCKLCVNQRSTVLTVIKRGCNQGANKSNHLN